VVGIARLVRTLSTAAFKTTPFTSSSFTTSNFPSCAASSKRPSLAYTGDAHRFRAASNLVPMPRRPFSTSRCSIGVHLKSYINDLPEHANHPSVAGIVPASPLTMSPSVPGWTAEKAGRCCMQLCFRCDHRKPSLPSVARTRRPGQQSSWACAQLHASMACSCIKRTESNRGNRTVYNKRACLVHSANCWRYAVQQGRVGDRHALSN
jgi:hypothetical protein